MRFVLQLSHLENILQSVARAAPLEACGLVAAQYGRSCEVFPVFNILASPTEFLMDPAQQITAMQLIFDKGWELAAIYHSHPAGPAVPSTQDLAAAAYPEVQHLIFSPGYSGWRVRAFDYLPGRSIERILRLVG